MNEPAPATQFTELEGRLAHRFSNTQLLSLALTHRSFSAEHNERLEFLGDSILNLIIADALFQRFPQASEGELSRLRAGLVKGVTLTEVGEEIGLGDYLRLGAGEAKSGGRRRASILADTVEALLGAIYLDADFHAVTQVVLSLYAKRLDMVDLDQLNKDPKTRLQELMQASKKPLPEYTLSRSTGKAHEKHFVVRCSVNGLAAPVEGEGSSRREAEQQAAQGALRLLGE